jgi:hypothetical protein
MDGSGRKIASALQIPCAVLQAEPEAWNMHGNARHIVAALRTPRFVLKVRGATHLDPESPTDLLGQLACGFTDPARQAVFRRYAIAFLKSQLIGEEAAHRTLDAAEKDANLTGVTNDLARP